MLGLKAIKAEGGVTIVQDPASARHDSMPRGALSTGCVDFVLQPTAIAEELVRLCRHPYVADSANGRDGDALNQDGVNTILQMLRQHVGVDFAQYKQPTVHRRILRRMALQRIDTLERYGEYLHQRQGELQVLFDDLLITVTEFFREPALFRYLASHIFPAICQQGRQDPIRIWVPACSTGEEVYSLAISLIEYLRDHQIEAAVQIFGTDLSEAVLEKARAGVYPASIEHEVPDERLQKYFTKVNGHYQIARSIRDLCIFARQNLTKDPPFSRLDLITCRNVLIYLGPALQQRLMRTFHFALKPTGFLAVGLSETAANPELFHPVDRRHKVYVRKGTAPLITLDRGSGDARLSEPPPQTPAVEKASVDEGRKAIDQLLLSRYAPPGVVIDGELNILEFRGRTAPFLDRAPGEAGLNLLRMSDGALGMEVRRLLQRVKARNAPARSEPMQLGKGTAAKVVRLLALPVEEGQKGEPASQFMVLFEEAKKLERSRPKPIADVSPGPLHTQRLRELEHELNATKVYLQTVIREQEATTEELRSANEEIQSSNEELLTAKEELQSTNEELSTVNEEMYGRNAELTEINNDITNLLSSINIPIVMLDNELRIRRFTPQAEKVLNLLPTDVGRPIGDLRPKLDVPDLEQLFQDVIHDLSAREREVQDNAGRHYSMWIRPYRRTDHKIDGAVLALFDLTDHKLRADSRYRWLFESSADTVIVADAASMQVIDVNPAVTSMFGLQSPAFLGKSLLDTGLFAPPELELLRTATTASSDQWKVLPLQTARRAGWPETEAIAQHYRQGSRALLQIRIRECQPTDSSRRDSQNMGVALRLATPVATLFNNVLTTILGHADRLERLSQLDPQQLEELRAIREATENGTAMTRQLEAFSQYEASGLEVVDLTSMLRDMEQVIRVLLAGTITLDLHLSEEPVLVKADMSRIEPIIVSIVAASRDLMPGGGLLRIETHNETVTDAFSWEHPAIPPGRYAVLGVTDRALGNPALNLAPLRLAAATALDNLEKHARELGGHVWSYSETGRGSHVGIYLPQALKEAAAEYNGTLEGVESILVVDPDSQVLDLTARVLSDRGYRVQQFRSSTDALAWIASEDEPVHAVVTELNMEPVSGLTLVKTLQRAFPQMQALIITGGLEGTSAEELSKLNHAQILRKPFSPAMLEQTIRSLFDGRLR
ncbi:hypothetical protein F183_A27890 [Bryobacterales bacterium F-183]|nr:hypothetical protein F183_A27890 [Bryobacterales bacterium F-183]